MAIYLFFFSFYWANFSAVLPVYILYLNLYNSHSLIRFQRIIWSINTSYHRLCIFQFYASIRLSLTYRQQIKNIKISIQIKMWFLDNYDYWAIQSIRNSSQSSILYPKIYSYRISSPYFHCSSTDIWPIRMADITSCPIRTKTDPLKTMPLIRLHFAIISICSISMR